MPSTRDSTAAAATTTPNKEDWPHEKLVQESGLQEGNSKALYRRWSQDRTGLYLVFRHVVDEILDFLGYRLRGVHLRLFSVVFLGDQWGRADRLSRWEALYPVAIGYVPEIGDPN